MKKIITLITVAFISVFAINSAFAGAYSVCQHLVTSAKPNA